MSKRIFINKLRVILNDILAGVVAFIAPMILICLVICGQCSAEPAAFGFYDENGAPFGNRPLQVGLAIPSVFGAWGDGSQTGCRGMILVLEESGLFRYDASLTWPAPCNVDAAFVLPVFDPGTGVLKIPVLMFENAFFWAKIEGFNVKDWGQFQTQ